MTDYFDPSLAIALGLAVTWTTIFSLANKPSVRGWRNLGILASYVLLIVFFFLADGTAVLATWAGFGIGGGVIYILWELFQRWRTPADLEKPAVSPTSLCYGLFFWPIMAPEAIEYTLAELGVLPAPPIDENAVDTEDLSDEEGESGVE